MEHYSKLFQSILEKPELVLGEKSITKMWFFIYGYKTGKGGAYDDELYEGFQSWVVERHQLGISHNWASVLLFLEGGCEYRAFDRAKRLWYQYKEEMESLNLPNAKED